MKKYNLINNILGWLCFVVAAVTYLLTLEPTASFWDCPEFIAQGAKLDIGHPPGNPIFMLTARFFVTVFGGGMQSAAIAVNTMSALLSAATILLLFWTITHLVRKIMLTDGTKEVSLTQMIVIMGAGLCGALAYTWSDTFWFSAVESEVYAFSSFCTALVFWLILKWENRADEPHSDRYLVLIAYIIGVSIAVHLLNLLCIPAIVLVFYFRKFKNINAKGALLALLLSFVIVAAILYGLVPGYIKVAQSFELFFVNTCGLSFNSGALIYSVLLVTLYIFTIHSLYSRKHPGRARSLFFLSLVMSGLTFITDNSWIWVILIIAFAVYILIFCVKDMPYRVFSVIALSLLVIFAGYSSYALLLIRANANPPMNQNAPDNVFTLASYLNREQYGESPLFYGPVFAETPVMQPYQDYDPVLQDYKVTYYAAIDSKGRPEVRSYDGILRYSDGAVVDNGDSIYSRAIKTSPSDPDRYVKATWKPKYENVPELMMPFTRMYSTQSSHIKGYKNWSGYQNEDLLYAAQTVPQNIRDRGYMSMADISYYMPNLEMAHSILGDDGKIDDRAGTDLIWKPSFADNLQYFFNYQLNHMYWRYFMWNFAGRQNDIQGNGEPYLGNWITGIAPLDNARLGDQSLLPEAYTTGNKGHNVYYMLPLIMGLLGIFWQALFRHKANPERGIEQFWVIFFLFFMTGVAIVLYLNQPPNQPRERDYAFAGSFYAFAIWIGMGVPAVAHLLSMAFAPKKAKKTTDAKKKNNGESAPRSNERPVMAAAVTAAAIGLIVPLQMVSQTWDDHDRSHRYTTRDFGENYLNSLDENAIIFTNGDNDTFPLWYAQEVEGVRTDVRVVNLSYLSTDWYANQAKHPYYDALPVPMQAKPEDYAYDRLQVVYSSDEGGTHKAIDGLRNFYANPKKSFERGGKEYTMMRTPNMYSPVDSAAVYRAFKLNPNSTDSITKIPYIMDIPMGGLKGNGFGLNTLLSFDIVATSIDQGFERPVYIASTVPNDMYLGMMPNLNSTGMAYQVTPFHNAPVNPLADKAYENIISRFKWGGLDDPQHNSGLYLDETVRRMVSSMRNAIVSAAADLSFYGDLPATEFAVNWATEHNLPIPQNRYDMARQLLNLMEEKMPGSVSPYEGIEGLMIPEYLKLYSNTGNPDDLQRAKALINESMDGYLNFAVYAASLPDNLFYSMGTAATYARINIPTLLAYLNYIDLIEAAQGDPEKLNAIERIMDIDDLYPRYADVNPMVYIDAYTPSEISAAYQNAKEKDERMVLGLGLAVAQLNEEIGVDPTARTKQYFNSYGLSNEGFNRLGVFLK